MYLHLLNTEEKEKFLELIYKVAHVDGNYAGEEQEDISNLKRQLGLTEIKDTAEISELVSYFAQKDMVIKKIVLLETLYLVNVDERIEITEAEVLDLMTEAFSLDDFEVNRIITVTQKLQDVYEEVNDVLFL